MKRVSNVLGVKCTSSRFSLVNCMVTSWTVVHFYVHVQIQKTFFISRSSPCLKSPTVAIDKNHCISLCQLLCTHHHIHVYYSDVVCLQVCGTCTGSQESSTVAACTSIDCPILHRRARAANDLARAQNLRDTLNKLFK